MPNARERDSDGGEESLRTKEDVSEKQNKSVVLSAATNTETLCMQHLQPPLEGNIRGVFRDGSQARCGQLFVIWGIFLEVGNLTIYSNVEDPIPFLHCAISTQAEQISDRPPGHFSFTVLVIRQEGKKTQ